MSVKKQKAACKQSSCFSFTSVTKRFGCFFLFYICLNIQGVSFIVPSGLPCLLDETCFFFFFTSTRVRNVKDYAGKHRVSAESAVAWQPRSDSGLFLGSTSWLMERSVPNHFRDKAQCKERWNCSKGPYSSRCTSCTRVSTTHALCPCGSLLLGHDCCFSSSLMFARLCLPETPFGSVWLLSFVGFGGENNQHYMVIYLIQQQR